MQQQSSKENPGATRLEALQAWVEEVAARTQPSAIHWCTGGDAEYRQLVVQMLEDGTLTALNHDEYPDCYLHSSDPSDVARVEHLTFVCTTDRADAVIYASMRTSVVLGAKPKFTRRPVRLIRTGAA